MLRKAAPGAAFLKCCWLRSAGRLALLPLRLATRGLSPLEAAVVLLMVLHARLPPGSIFRTPRLLLHHPLVVMAGVLSGLMAHDASGEGAQGEGSQEAEEDAAAEGAAGPSLLLLQEGGASEPLPGGEALLSGLLDDSWKNPLRLQGLVSGEACYTAPLPGGR